MSNLACDRIHVQRDLVLVATMSMDVSMNRHCRWQEMKETERHTVHQIHTTASKVQ